MPLTHALSDRRSLIATLALLPLAACATPMSRYTVEQAVRRLLQLSSERAFARLTEPGGFYDDQLTRITPPDLGGGTGGAVLSALLRTDAVRSRVAMALNDVAVDLADNAAPIVVPAGQLFVMGDNRDNSLDSRFPAVRDGGVGLVDTDLLVGRASRVLWSTDGSAEWLLPWTWFTAARWERIGADI